MDDDDLGLETFAPVSKARPIDWLIIGIDFARRLVGEVETAMANVEQMLVGHANYQAEQQAFADQVRLEIESLTQED